MSRNTRTRILVTSLMLFNEKGEPATTTNEIADAVDISPGNLHYHFNKKSDLVDALLLEFQADARKVMLPPDASQSSLDDFWVFLHRLLELTAAYRFLLRDMETLVMEYPKVRNALKHFARALEASLELYLRSMADGGVIRLDRNDAGLVSRNLAVIALFSEKFDTLTGSRSSPDDASLRVAAAVLNLLTPVVVDAHAQHVLELTSYYKE